MYIENYTFINQVVLKLVGLYPISIVRYIVCISSIIVIVIPLIAQIYNNWGNLNIILETSSVLFTISLGILKSLIWMLNRKDLEFFVKFMLTDYWNIVKIDVFNQLHIYAIFAKKITKGYLFLIFNALLFFFSLPIIDAFITFIQDSTSNFTVKGFPFVASYPLAFYDFPFYEIVYVSQMLATTTCGLMILAIDTLIATALLHTCGHYEILKENLKQLNSDICYTSSTESNAKTVSYKLHKVKNQVAHIIKHHRVILWFCDSMEKNFHLMLFLQTVASSLIICFIGFQVSTTLMEHSKVVKFSSHLMMAVFQLLLFCFPGDVLISQSFSISSATYAIQWYELPALIKNEVCMIILRSQKPSCITAGKIYVMHLENFSTTLSTALSYFMMLRSFTVED
ncbi:odorant receptor 13a-like [Calliopsis andreniformis]|uniref:odorant receptor 13a-like n=1 Tax=Calliopsis andreniformis TaxID=337506 RepID=UPI003FCD9652